MAGKFALLAACVATLVGATVATSGNLMIISSDLTLEGLVVRGGEVERSYYLQVQVNEEDVLREPCPYCQYSYNQYFFSSQQIILPSSSEKLYAITFLDGVPYLQIIQTPRCLPISTYRPMNDYGILYLQCRNPGNPEQVLLALLVGDGDDDSFVRWTYDTFPIIDGLTTEGSFYEYYNEDLNHGMVTFTYARSDVLIFLDPINNYLRFLGLPDGCVEVVRITPCHNQYYHILLECSSTADSPTITSVHVLDPDTEQMTKILDTSYNLTSPVRMLHTRSEPPDTIVVMFTETVIILQSILDSSVAVRVPVPAPVYDGRITTVDGSSYAVYCAAGSLYVLNTDQATFQPLRLALSPSDEVCTQSGCPLIEFIDSNTVAIALKDSRIALVTVAPRPSLLTITESTDLPMRLIFIRAEPPNGGVSSHSSQVAIEPTSTIGVSDGPTPTVIRPSPVMTTKPSQPSENITVDSNPNFSGSDRIKVIGLSVSGAIVIAVTMGTVLTVLTVVGVSRIKKQIRKETIPQAETENLVKPVCDKGHKDPSVMVPGRDGGTPV